MGFPKNDTPTCYAQGNTNSTYTYSSTDTNAHTNTNTNTNTYTNTNTNNLYKGFLNFFFSRSSWLFTDILIIQLFR